MAMPTENHIDYSDKHNPVLRIYIGDYTYGFSLQNTEKEYHIWMLDVVGHQMQEIHNRASYTTKISMQDSFQKLIGIKK